MLFKCNSQFRYYWIIRLKYGRKYNPLNNMTHQQRAVSVSCKSKEKTSGGGKSKPNSFLRLSLPGECCHLLTCWLLVPRYFHLNCPGLGLLRKFQQYRRLPQDPPPAQGHHLEEELDRLTCKIVGHSSRFAAV